jgi:hypothetical protein
MARRTTEAQRLDSMTTRLAIDLASGDKISAPLLKFARDVPRKS